MTRKITNKDLLRREDVVTRTQGMVDIHYHRKANADTGASWDKELWRSLNPFVAAGMALRHCSTWMHWPQQMRACYAEMRGYNKGMGRAVMDAMSDSGMLELL